MRTVLKVEHHIRDRHVRSRFVRPGNQYFTVGSARDARLRLLGSEVEGVHAVIEWVNDHWRVSDVGSRTGTWHNQEAILTCQVDRPMTIQIGEHELRLTPIVKTKDLFQGNRGSISANEPGELVQEIVVRRHGHILRVDFLKPNASYRYLHGVKINELPAARTAHWETSHFADVSIQRRLVKVPASPASDYHPLREILRHENRKGILRGVALFLLILASIKLLPQSDQKDLPATNRPDNRFSQIIFDANKVKKQRAQAENLTQMIQQKSEPLRSVVAPTSPGKVTVPKAMANAPKVTSAIKNIRATGLNQLIGKISKRTARGANFIVVQGVSPDQAGTGPARGLASLGELQIKAGAAAVGKVTVNGISTAGVGGGAATDLRGVAGLSVGKIGASEVGIIEEETSVEGGLEKEVIASFIKNQLGQIRYCYERQLSANPELYGKIHVRFTIAADGRVAQPEIHLTTLQNAMVEGCILRRVAAWKFPEPKGGTMVLVTYPFLFKSHR